MLGSWRSVLVEEKLFEGREEETVDESLEACYTLQCIVLRLRDGDL